MNTHGSSRLSLNILVLQQNLKNIEPDASLSRSATYYDLFTLGSEQIVKRAKDQGKDMGFSNEQITILLKLVYSEALKSERRDISVAAERGLASDELLLSEYLWS
jgi:exocyst complex component 4